MQDDQTPAHHAPGGRFRNPWPGLAPEPGGGDILRWSWERSRMALAPNPPASAFPRRTADPALPRVPADAAEARVTWVGQATFLVQLPGLTLLTDPVFGDRASPFSWAGPRRLSAPGMKLEELPPVDAVLLSHDHYDHLDSRSVRALARREPDATWFAPLGHQGWLARRGVRRVVEMDWWEEASHAGPTGAVAGIRCLPVRHWTKRRMLDARRRLWSAWRVEAGGRRLYFGGDSGYAPCFAETSAREAPFDIALLPIGAYEPRWFMAAAHMSPEEAAQAYVDLGGRGACVGMHWGTFRLTDEHPLEPPARMRRAWAALGLPADHLYIPAHGETLRL